MIVRGRKHAVRQDGRPILIHQHPLVLTGLPPGQQHLPYPPIVTANERERMRPNARDRDRGKRNAFSEREPGRRNHRRHATNLQPHVAEAEDVAERTGHRTLAVVDRARNVAEIAILDRAVKAGCVAGKEIEVNCESCDQNTHNKKANVQ